MRELCCEASAEGGDTEVSCKASTKGGGTECPRAEGGGGAGCFGAGGGGGGSGEGEAGGSVSCADHCVALNTRLEHGRFGRPARCAVLMCIPKKLND